MNQERILTATVHISQILDYVPFSIDLPNDVKEVTGVFVDAEAKTYIAGAGTLNDRSTVVVNSFSKAFVRPYSANIKLRNQASGYYLTKEIDNYSDGGKYKIGANIKRFQLGSCTLKTNFQGAGAFHKQDLYPSQAIFPFAAAAGEYLSERISYGKPGVPFSEVSVGGKAKELEGFFEWNTPKSWTIIDADWFKTNKATLLASEVGTSKKYLSGDGIKLTIYLRYI